jgi:pimeloyl-ACP methyl ester carboxylesterase
LSTDERVVGRLHYLEVRPPASARPRGALVLLHAFPLSARMWEPQFELADRGWHIIAPEFGKDAVDLNAGAATVTMDTYAGEVIDLFDALHVEDVVIGGCSMGGYLAFALYRRAPNYIRGFLLADTRAQADTPEALEGRKKMLQLVADKGTPAIVDEMVPKLLGETTRKTRPEVVDRVKSIALATSAEAVAGMIRGLMTRQDSVALLSSIHLPTLIVVGEEDTLTPPPMSEQMHKTIAGSELAILPKVGHLPNLEDSRKFNEVVARFLDHRI